MKTKTMSMKQLRKLKQKQVRKLENLMLREVYLELLIWASE